MRGIANLIRAVRFRFGPLGGYSSVGRAPALQAGCHRFESVYLQMKYLLIKDRRRRVLFHTYEHKRRALTALYQDRNLTPDFRQYIYTYLIALPRDSSCTRYRNRCPLTNRPRGIYRHFGRSRIIFRFNVWRGKLLGVKKSTW